MHGLFMRIQGMNNVDPSQMSEAEQRIVELLRTPAPRSIPSGISHAAISPIANFLILLGILTVILGAGLCLMVVLRQGRTPLAAWLAPGLLAVGSLGLMVWGLASRQRTIRLLSTGILCPGYVRAVSPLPARINGRWFFRVRVDVHLPNGTTVRGKDTVDNWAVEYFLDARDRQKEINVLYSADVPHAVILPTRIAITRRFD
jgi:hypothetical protein